jgi:hypothetical protein
MREMTDFWDIAKCSAVEIDRRFRGAYYLHYQVNSPYDAARHNVAEDCHLHSRCRDNMKPHQAVERGVYMYRRGMFLARRWSRG